MTIRTECGFQNSARILRGPLVYSLQIGEEFRRVVEMLAEERKEGS